MAVLGSGCKATLLISKIMNIIHRQIITSYNKILFDVYNEEKLLCIADKSIKIEDKYVMSFYYDTIHPFTELNTLTFFNSMIIDIFNCSKDLKYCVGSLFLYKPHINNPLEQAFKIGDLDTFPRDQNIFDRRYSLYASLAIEKLYNYWDRIGDLLNAVLKVIDDERRVYFYSVIDNIQEVLKNSENYKWLASFRENEFKEFNNIRKGVVHYRMLETEYSSKHLNALHDREAMEKLQSEKESYPSFYKDHLEKTITGFEKAINLLKEYKETLSKEAN